MTWHRSIAAAASVLAASAADLTAQQGTFFLIVPSGDTIAVEQFTRTPARVESELLVKVGGARFNMTATLAGDATVARFENAFRTANADPASPPAQTAIITFPADSAIAVITTGANTVTQGFASQRGAIPFVNPSFALVEQLVRRARIIGGASAGVPVFLVQGGQTVPFTVTWSGADSAVIDMAGVPARIAVDREGAILGGFVPSQGLRIVRSIGAPAGALEVAPPDYSAPPGAPYSAEDVTIPTPGGFTLAGTLTLPSGAQQRVPAVVTITGSGLQDRDGSISLVRGYVIFREVADTLSRRGIAVLRMDDRGYGASGGSASAATSADFADDIRAGLAWLRRHPAIDRSRLGLIGHSEGGIIAPMIAARDTALAGVVLLAAPAWSGRRVVEWQNAYALERAPTVAPSARDSLLDASMRIVDSTLVRTPWGRFFATHDPLAAARRVAAVPVLILHGETDRQVTVEQAQELAAAFRAGGNGDVSVRTFPGANHLFLADPDGYWGHYTRLTSGSVERAVLGTIADWLAVHLRRS
jgi:dipeptidyl aminopeptidase/acylaminoacyl peptidase